MALLFFVDQDVNSIVSLMAGFEFVYLASIYIRNFWNARWLNGTMLKRIIARGEVCVNHLPAIHVVNLYPFFYSQPELKPLLRLAVLVAYHQYQ